VDLSQEQQVEAKVEEQQGKWDLWYKWGKDQKEWWHLVPYKVKRHWNKMMKVYRYIHKGK
jgi:hypothetical protein